ncbi:MAG: Anaphase-promoting complex subunit 1 [Trizodia sp. TS-e1964]|nr:MAG: Anaphase-promoting complex subunit 1 [Trizodia sp. TS-e1964]
MASITSLGTHSPSAIPYLVAENIISKDISSNLYEWKTYVTGEDDGWSEEELFITEECVVWSQGGIVRRLLRFDIEGEKIVKALFAWFPSDDTAIPPVQDAAGLHGTSNQPAAAGRPSAQVGRSGWSVAARSHNTQLRPGPKPAQLGAKTLEQARSSPRANYSKAIVVVLKTQAHIYFISGASHIIHLPFEVDSVLPAPRGIILQRKISRKTHVPPTPIPPSVPPNSFISHPLSVPSSQVPVTPVRAARKQKSIFPSLSFSDILVPKFEVENILPRTFSLTDPLIEMGLVVESPLTQGASFSTSHGPSPTISASLNQDEELIYISTPEEFTALKFPHKKGDELILALTANRESGMYSVWYVSYLEAQSLPPRRKKRTPSASGTLSKRRSSYGPGGGTGATTPVGHGPSGTRESFGARGQASLGQSITNMASSLTEDLQNDEAGQLASQLNPEMQSHAAPAKESRRVSSLLARADLSTSHDRLAFSDLASGHAISSGINHHGANRRGDSFGGQSVRASFGALPVTASRSSMPGTSSFTNSLSAHKSEAPVDELLQELDFTDFDEAQVEGSSELTAGLRKELIMKKVESFPMEMSQQVSLEPKTFDKLSVFSLVPPSVNSAGTGENDSVVLCISDSYARTLLMITFQIREHHMGVRFSAARNQNVGQKSQSSSWDFVPCQTGLREWSRVISATKITDGDISRILVLAETPDGCGELTLQAPWSTTIKINLPNSISTKNAYNIGGDSIELENIPMRPRSEVLHFITGLQHPGPNGKVDVLDKKGTRYRIQLRMRPHNEQVGKILAVCRYLLPGGDRGGEGMLVGWWELLKWLKMHAKEIGDPEWTALIVLICLMAVASIKKISTSGFSSQRKGWDGLLPYRKSASITLANWKSMLEGESTKDLPTPNWLVRPAWNWILEEDRSAGVGNPETSGLGDQKSDFLIRCVSLAQTFMRSPSGVEACGSYGYLPTAQCQDLDCRRTALATILIGLHLLREEQKLDVSTADAGRMGADGLAPILAQIGGWLGWPNWSWKESGYYYVEDADMENWIFEESIITGLDIPTQPFPPPSIYDWVEKCLGYKSPPPFLSLKEILKSVKSSQNTFFSPHAIQEPWYHLTPRTVKIVSCFTQIFLSSPNMNPSEYIPILINGGIDNFFLDSLPEGIVASLREAISTCQGNPPTTWDGSSLSLIDRQDLRILISSGSMGKVVPKYPMTNNHESLQDIQTICSTTFEPETTKTFDGNAEQDRQAVTRLLFREDRRFKEAVKLLQSTKPTTAQCIPEPEWSEAELLDAQKELVQSVALRILAVPSGRGLLYFNARIPLVTEKFPIAPFNLNCVMKPSNNTVTADKSAFTEDKVCWAFFHAGVAAGLSISKDAKGVDTSWIIFNKPPELTNRHAGFLFALGLNDHLKSLAKWVAFKYLTPKHTMTSIGLLLGLACSYLGTMDALVTKLLSVHVVRMLPPNSADINLTPLTQTAGLLGLGLLYCNTQHRRMSEVMLSEIEFVGDNDPTLPVDPLRDEGYRLSAGFALGFINLGKGNDLRGLYDMQLVDRLLALAVGSKRVDIVHILDKSTASATIAIALIFMKTHDEPLARKIDIPDTILQFDYVRPDIFLLRTLARHLIMWDDIQPTQEWISIQIPEEYRTKGLNPSGYRLDSIDLPFYNIIAGLCFSIGLKYAGSGALDVRQLLCHYLDDFIALCRLPALNYDQRLSRNTLRNCQDLIALSAATVMAGTGDILIFRRLRSLHGRVDTDTPYGSHLMAHIAIGVLFLGGGNYTFGTSNVALAALVCAFYPLYPTAVLDNKCHLQAFRHLWVLATEARCLVPRDVDSQHPISIPILISLRNGKKSQVTAPCLLPPLSTISQVSTASPQYWSVVLDFAKNPSHLAFFTNTQTIFVRKRAANDIAASSSIFLATLHALDDNETSHSPLEWLLTLPAFSGFDKAERALVLPPDAKNSNTFEGSGLQSTAVDARLVLEKASLNSGNRDRLANLALIFAWADKVERDGGNLRWIRREVIDNLRAAIWILMQDGGSS